MKASYLTIQGEDCYFELLDMFEREIKISFKSNIIDGVLLFAEDYSMMNSSDLMIVIRIQKINSKEDQCEIEIVSGGGGEGLFSLTFGNEKRRLNKFADLIYEFCQQRRYRASELVITK